MGDNPRDLHQFQLSDVKLVFPLPGLVNVYNKLRKITMLFMDKFSTAIFNSYVKLPEGTIILSVKLVDSKIGVLVSSWWLHQQQLS